MDLSTIKNNETIDIVIMNPMTNVETDIIITVHTTDSKKYNSIIHQIQNERMHSRQKKLTAEAIDARGKETLAKCTESWKNVSLGGKTLECTVKNAIMVYEEYAWLFDQVNVEMNNRANFLSVVPQN